MAATMSEQAIKNPIDGEEVERRSADHAREYQLYLPTKEEL
jgi:hypothetical protein